MARVTARASAAQVDSAIHCSSFAAFVPFRFRHRAGLRSATPKGATGSCTSQSAAEPIIC